MGDNQGAVCLNLRLSALVAVGGQMSEAVIETKHQVVAVEVEAPVLGATVALGRVVAALVAEETDVGHEAEMLGQVERDARTESDAIFNGRVAVGAPNAEVYAAIHKKVDLACLEIGVSGIGIDLEHGLLLAARFAVGDAEDGADGEAFAQVVA